MSRESCRWDGELWQSWVSIYTNAFTFERRPQSVTHQKGGAKRGDTIQILGNSLVTVYSLLWPLLPYQERKQESL